MWLAKSLGVRRAQHWAVGVAVSGILAGWCGGAAADPAAAVQDEPGVHTHDGFYLRFANGFGVYDELAKSESDQRFDGQLRVRARGFAIARELAFGGTPYPGLSSVAASTDGES